MKFLNNLFKMKYTGKILSGLITVIQTWIMYGVMTLALYLVKSSTLTMGIISAVISFIILIISIIKDHSSNYIDVNSEYNKERRAHDLTKKELKTVEDALEEKKDYIHAITSCMNNTFVTKQTETDQIVQFRKLMVAINKEKKLSNCGNSKAVKKDNNLFLREILDI